MVDPDRPFQPSLMFVGKARSLPKSGTPERCFMGRHRPFLQTFTRLEKTAREKRSSFLQTLINFGCKKLYNFGPSIGVPSKCFIMSLHNCLTNILNRGIQYLMGEKLKVVWAEFST